MNVHSFTLLFLTPLALLSVTVGCNDEKKDKQDPTVVATVNGEILSRADFEQELSRELKSIDPVEPHTPEQIEPLKRALVDTLVQRMLLMQEVKKNNIVVTPEEIDRGLMRISSDYPAESFNDALAQGQLSIAELKAKTAVMLSIEKLFQGHLYPRVAVTEDEIRRYFEANAAELQEPEEVHAAQIVVKGLDDAKRLQGQLATGKKFSDLARKYSLSADAKVGGDLGFFGRGVMPPKFDEACFSLPVGSVSGIVESEYGFHLFKVLEKRAPRKKELSEVRRQVEEKLLTERRSHAEAEYSKALRERAQVVVNDQTVQSISGKAQGGARVAEP
ncbi:MAG: peptidylprolyl isomerase [Myxococcaceae bacterium]